MKHLMNNQGYALLTVLITIMVIFSFSLILFPKTINTSLQVNKSEGISRTKEMSEMGIKYAHAYLQNQITQAIADAKADSRYINNTVNHDTLFCEKIKNRFKTFNTYNKEIPMDINPNFSFQVKNFEDVTFEPSTITLNNTVCGGFTSLKVPIESIGKVKGNSNKSVKAYFIIENKAANGTPSGSAGTSPGTDSGPVDPNTLSLITENNSIDIKGNTVSNMYSAVHFTKVVTIGGNGKLMIGGNAWFEGNPSVNFNGNNGILIISGDSYFNNKVSLGGNNTNYICIKGDAYLKNNGTWVDYPDVKKICPYTEKEVQYYYDINEWGIIESNLNVIY